MRSVFKVDWVCPTWMDDMVLSAKETSREILVASKFEQDLTTRLWNTRKKKKYSQEI